MSKKLRHKGYKVVRTDTIDDVPVLVSPFRAVHSGGVVYAERQDTVPLKGNGPLCVLNDLQGAISYARELCECFDYDVRIYECDYNLSTYNGVWTKCDDTGCFTDVGKLRSCYPSIALASRVRLGKYVGSVEHEAWLKSCML